MISVHRYAARIGSALALLLTCLLGVRGVAVSADQATFTFEGQRITFTQVISQSAGRAVSIDDPGLHQFFDRIGATVTHQPGDRYLLITTAEPVVISFALGDTRFDIGPVTQNAAFAPFMQGGHAYVPLNELLHALDFAAKPDGAQMVLQPQLAAIDVDSSSGRGTKIVAHAGMPLDARIVSDKPDKLVVAFDGVGTTLNPTRNITGGAVRRIDLLTGGPVTRPVTYATLYLNPGTTHGPAGTDDQRDFTIGFNGASTVQRIAATQPTTTEPTEPQAAATPVPSPAASAPGPVQVTGVTMQNDNGSATVHIAIDGGASFEWHRLRPPDNRFWIDVRGSHLAAQLPDQNGPAPVTAIRVRQQSADTVRVALSLSDFNVLNVTPDASGITIVVDSAVADDSVARAGAGTVGVNAVAAAQPSPSPGWKFGPQPSPGAKYVAPNPRLIVIDPGHGGSDAGAIRGDAVEKDLAMDMSRRLKAILIARGWQVIMTHETDRDVFAPNDSAHDELQARDDIANNNGARLLISIHVNSFINSGPHGATAYYYKSSDVALAQAVDRRIAAQVPVRNIGMIKDKLYVVNHANMPATLIETAFVSNPDDRRLLQDPAWRQKMAEAIADGILDYAGAPPAATTGDGQ